MVKMGTGAEDVEGVAVLESEGFCFYLSSFSFNCLIFQFFQMESRTFFVGL